MNNRTLTVLTVIVLLGIGTILLLNIASFFREPINHIYVSKNDVQGMAVEYNKKLFTLNFEQQVKAIDYLNGSLPIPQKSVQRKLAQPNFEKIIIYKFNGPDVEITPVGFDQNELIFKAPEWNSQAIMKEFSNGNFKNLINSAIDPNVK